MQNPHLHAGLHSNNDFLKFLTHKDSLLKMFTIL